MRKEVAHLGIVDGLAERAAGLPRAEFDRVEQRAGVPRRGDEAGAVDQRDRRPRVVRVPAPSR